MLLYIGKGGNCECSNLRGISLLSIVGRLYGRVLTKRVRAGTNCAIGEEPCGFRQGRGCIDQFLLQGKCVKSICRKGKMYFGRLWMSRRPMIGTLDRCKEWQMQRVQAAQGFYE